MSKTNLRAALLGSGAAVAMMAASVPASADELSELRAQIDALQNQLSTLETRQDVVESQGSVAPAAAIEAGDRARTFRWAGTDTSVNIGGYAKLDVIFDLGPDIGDSASRFAVPADGAVADGFQDNFRLHARQSRFWIKTWTPTDWGEMATHIEGDFEGGGGNQNISNSTGFRLRHAYGRLGPVLAGQTWTNFMDVSSLMNTIDFNGQAGISFVRQAQLRYTHAFGDSGFRVALAIENPESRVRAGAATITSSGGAAAGAETADPAPDFTGQAQYHFSGGHVSLRGVLRVLEVNAVIGGAQVSDTAVGWGLGASGAYSLGDNDAIGGEFNIGNGIGRYGFDAAGLIAASVNGAGNLDLNDYWGGAVWYAHNWTDTISSNVGYGYGNGDPNVSTVGFAGAAGLTHSIHSVHANLMWSPVSSVNFGVEAIYLARNIEGASNNDTMRFQLGMQYKF